MSYSNETIARLLLCVCANRDLSLQTVCFLSNCCVHLAIILDYGVAVIKTINNHVLDYFVIYDCMKTFIMRIVSDVRPQMCCNTFVV